MPEYLPNALRRRTIAYRMANLELVLFGLALGVPCGVLVDRFLIHPLVDLRNLALRRGGRGPRP